MARYSSSPAQDFEDAEPDDDFVFDPPFRGIHVGTGGTVVLLSVTGKTGTFIVPDGGRIDAVGVRILEETDAEDLVVMY